MSTPALADTPQDYFTVFSLPRRLGIDTAQLEQRFYALSRKLHPDLFARKSPEEQAWSLAQSSQLNDAYRTLKDPIARTEYLLKLEGIRAGDEGSETKKPAPPSDLLEEAFELNMQLEEMRANRKMGEDDPQLHAGLTEAQAQYGQLLSITDGDLESAWTEWDLASAAGEGAMQSAALTRMAALLDRRRYLRNLVRDVTEVLATP